MLKLSLPFSLLFIAQAALSAPWGALSDYDLPAPPAGHSRAESLGMPVSAAPGERYLLKPVLEGKTIKVFLNPGEESAETLSVYREKIAEAYNEWFAQTAKQIRSSRREREFADILPVLDRGISVEFVEDGEDIVFEFVDRREISSLCGLSAAACYSSDGPVIFVPKNPRDRNTIGGLFGRTSGKLLFVSLVHEIGHSLGFSDQYARSRGNTHPVYHGGNHRSSVMNSSRKLTCDDADGVVNLIDITRRTRRGGNTGWRSLCGKSKTYYIGGVALGNGPYVFMPKSVESAAWVVRKYQDGQAVWEKEFVQENREGVSPLDAFSETPLERDPVGRTVLARGPRGEEVYYSYLYGRTYRFVTAGRKILLLEWLEKNLPGERSFEHLLSEFALNGKTASLRSERNGSRGSLFYKEGSGDDSMSVQMEFKKGKAVHVVWNGEDERLISGVAVPSAAGAVVGMSEQIQKRAEKRLNQARREQLERLLKAWYLRR